jgi:hypothetical protein
LTGGDEGGQLTVFVALLAVPLVGVVGLVVDGGGVLAAHQKAVADAFEAARAGAEAVDIGVLRASGVVQLDPGQARSDALAFLAAAGETGSVAVAGDSVTVTVSVRHPLAVLSMFGLGPVTVTGRATATATQGITGAGS